jgi:hypothetical protein
MYEHIKCTVADGIATITIDRPAANNSLNMQMFRDLIQTVEHCGAEDAVKVIVITGAGKNFSAGGDIKEMATFEFISYELSMLTGQTALCLRRCKKPIIAMVNGAAAGGGCGIALAADFRIMTEESYLLTAFSNVALPGDTGCIYNLHQIVGLAKTIELMAFSAPIYGAEALRLGLATKVTAANNLLDETMAFAAKLMRRPLGAIAMQKQLYYEIFYRDYMMYSRLESENLAKAGKSADHREAVTAFLEGRKPMFNQD